jgi:hypothetical protein
MPSSPKRMEPDPAWKSDRATYQIMYLAKRPSYEFIFAIPENHPLFLSAEQALFQLRFKDQRQAHEIVLTLAELEDFYDKLSQLVEYIRAERERRSRHL